MEIDNMMIDISHDQALKHNLKADLGWGWSVTVQELSDGVGYMDFSTVPLFV